MSFNECPYCGNDFTAGHWNGDPLNEGEEAETRCRKCGKTFKLIATYSLDFYTEEIEEDEDA